MQILCKWVKFSLLSINWKCLLTFQSDGVPSHASKFEVAFLQTKFVHDFIELPNWHLSHPI